MEKTWLFIFEVIKLFEYKKSNEKYWDKAKLHKQVVSKALLIAKVFYLSYSLLFLFDNIISYFVYINNILYIRNINESLNNKH